MAENLPNARLVEFDGEDHWFWAGDQGAILAEIRAFAAGLMQNGR